MNKVIGEVENVIEREDPAKNSSIANKTFSILDNPDKIGKFTQKYDINSTDLLDYPLPILI